MVNAVVVHDLAVGTSGEVLVRPFAIRYIQLVKVAVLEAAGGSIAIASAKRVGTHHLQLQLEGEAGFAA